MRANRERAVGCAVRRWLPALSAVILGLPVLGKELDSGLDPRVKEEILYAETLKNWGMPDYADLVVSRITHPEAESIRKVIQLESKIAIAKWDEVKAIIAREPDPNAQTTWAMKLALADGYYAFGKYPEAQALYEDFFRKFPSSPPPSLNSFYMESAYKFAQMLILMGKEEAALRAYDAALRAKLDRHVRRQVLGEKSEIMMKLAEKATGAERDRYFKDIEKINNEILWVQDLWFGKAIVGMAHIKQMQGDVDGAIKLVEDYDSQLRAIDEVLRKQAEEEQNDALTRLSPMAECRYMLGRIMQDEAERLLKSGGDRERVVRLLAGKKTDTGKRTDGALHHFYNVFAGYPGTPWAPEAGERARHVEEVLKREFSAKITTKIDAEQMQRVQQYQFQGARSLFNQQQFEPAVEAYLKVLNLFPEQEASVSALGELARCYIEMDDELSSDMVLRYLAERFGERDEFMSRAGDEVLRVAFTFEERNMAARRDAMYNVFFTNFRRHPRTPALLYQFGEKAVSGEDYERALGFYTKIATNYPDSTVGPDALSKVALCHSRMGQYADEIRTLTNYVKRIEAQERPGHALINGKFRLAYAYKQLGQKHIPAALNRFAELCKLLDKPDPRYQKTAEEGEKNHEILEASLFYKAVCFSMLTEPADKLTAFKQAALQSLNDLVTRFPKSKFAPSALSQIGTLWTILGNAEEAQKMLLRLQKEYPDSAEAKNALFMLGRNLLDLGLRRQAVEVFREMFGESGGRYTENQILTAGKELAKAGEYEIAAQAFERVLAAKDSEKRMLREPALLGKGQCLLALKKPTEAIAVLETMLKEFPKSGLTVEACVLLSRAYSETAEGEADENRRFDLFNAAVRHLKTARKYEQNESARAGLDVALARIRGKKAATEEKAGNKAKAREYRDEAIATYQAVVQFGNPTDPVARQHIDAAFDECAALLAATERWRDVIEDANRYDEVFPDGKFLPNMRKWRNQALRALARTGAEVVRPVATAPAASNKVERVEPNRAEAPKGGG